MERGNTFADSSGLFAVLVKNDPFHEAACAWLKRFQARNRRLVTTDYVLDECVTLLGARRVRSAVPVLFDLLERSDYLLIEWIATDRFFAARDFLLRHDDHDYSFTDCTSFVVMRELGLTEALATDEHFRAAGFHVALPQR